jgi:hypothetical protein
VTTRPDRPPCAGTMRDSNPCPNRARLGSRYCTLHHEQRPAVPVPYLCERVSTRFATPRRVHLGYLDADPPWLLCTGSLARSPRSYDPTMSLCPNCRPLIVAAVDRGEVEPDDFRRWRLGEANVDEARS